MSHIPFEFLGSTILLNPLTSVSLRSSDLGNTPFVALLFAANWCETSKILVNRLKSIYKDVNSLDSNPKLEIIFISLDVKVEEFEEMYEDMPWCAMQYDYSRASNLASDLGVTYLP